MSQLQPLVLVVEDSPPLGRLYAEFARAAGYRARHCVCGADAEMAIREERPALVLLDLELPDVRGLDLLEQWQQADLAREFAVVVVTGHGSVSAAVEAMRLGASDFIEKPFNVERFKATAANALAQRRLQTAVATLGSVETREDFEGFIGSSLPMQVAYRVIDAAAASKATVFITGESGTGKEVCAQAIHNRSERHEGPFVALNCGAIPKDLFESEIFGHIKGAFSGATADRVGAAERADGGTLFLDEIGEMDMDLQVKLLRFIQTGTFSRVGCGKPRRVNVRFVCATNRDPQRQIADGTFREDLYFRLNVVPIQLPALRDREGDVLTIARHFLRSLSNESGKAFKRLSPEVEQCLQSYDWPGNIRQLRNVIENVVVLNAGEVVTREMLPAPLDKIRSVAGGEPVVAEPAVGDTTPVSPEAPAEPDEIEPLSATERRAIEGAIRKCGGNIPVAAAFLGVSASTIYRKKQLWAQDVQAA